MTKYNQLQISASKKPTRVGRGISAGQGKTAGRGTKGQGARTGKKLRATFQGGQRALVQAVPKKRGFKSLRTPAQIVYLDSLNDFKGQTADNFSLFEQGYIATPFHTVKVILRGQLTTKVALHIQAISKNAEKALVEAGGSFAKTDTPLKAQSQQEEKKN